MQAIQRIAKTNFRITRFHDNQQSREDSTLDDDVIKYII